MLGKKQIEQLAGFTGSAVAYGLGAFVTMVYFTEWKTVTKLIPYYNGKYTNDKEKK